MLNLDALLQVGDLNVILSVPHGGSQRPSSIPNRDAGYFDNAVGRPRYDHHSKNKDPGRYAVRFKKDTNTINLALHIADELKQLTGKRPHVIICHMHRSKLDMNCDREKATFSVLTAELAWDAYHNYITRAKQTFAGGIGLFFDIHGQGHIENWVELGYTLTSSQLNDQSYTSSDTSVRFVANRFQHVPIKELICGLDSFGGILLDEGYKVVPSPTYLGPGNGNYYNGGYNTRVHGSRHSGIVDGIQIETPHFLRQDTMIPEYSKAIARTIVKFLQLYYQPKEDEAKNEDDRKEEVRSNEKEHVDSGSQAAAV